MAKPLAGQAETIRDQAETIGRPSERLALEAPQAPHSFGMGRAERDLLSIMARSVGMRATAAGLGVAEQEVRVHLASAVRKLGAGSLLEALIVAVRRGNIRRPVRD